MDKKDEGEEAFAMIAIKENQNGKDLKTKTTSWRALGYKSKFVENIKAVKV